MEEVPGDPAFSMTTSLKKENSLEVCAKVCPTSNLQKIRLKQFFHQYIGAKEETKMVVMEIEMVTGRNQMCQSTSVSEFLKDPKVMLNPKVGRQWSQSPWWIRMSQCRGWRGEK